MSYDIIYEWNKVNNQYKETQDPMYQLAQRCYKNCRGELNDETLFINHDFSYGYNITPCSYDEDSDLYEYKIDDLGDFVKYIKHFQSHPMYGGVLTLGLEDGDVYEYVVPTEEQIIYPEGEYYDKLNDTIAGIIKRMPDELYELAQELKGHVTKIEYNSEDGGILIHTKGVFYHNLLEQLKYDDCIYVESQYEIVDKYNNIESFKQLVAYHYTIPSSHSHESLLLFQLNAHEFFTN